MKKYIVLMAIAVLMPVSLWAKTEKEESIIENNIKNFEFKLDLVYPSIRLNANQFNPEGYIMVSDSTADGKLPYFGRTFYTDYKPIRDSGITFNGKMKDLKIEKIYRNKNKTKIKNVEYTFQMKDLNDESCNFRIVIDKDNQCKVYVNSENRTPITYLGTVSTIKP